MKSHCGNVNDSNEIEYDLLLAYQTLYYMFYSFNYVKFTFDIIRVVNDNFYNEFVIEVNDSESFLAKLKENGILGGIKISNKKILVCATEMNSAEDIDTYISSV